MRDFKIVFPIGYQVSDVFDDNLDINIVFENGDVFFGTLFTLSNVEKIMSNENEDHFWSTDMLIVRNLELSTIKKAINKIVYENYEEEIFSKIGTIQTIFPQNHSFHTIIDMQRII